MSSSWISNLVSQVNSGADTALMEITSPLWCWFPQGLFAMRAEEEVLPMVLSRSGPTAPEDLRAIVSQHAASGWHLGCILPKTPA